MNLLEDELIFYEWNFETDLTYFCAEINDLKLIKNKLMFKTKISNFRPQACLEN